MKRQPGILSVISGDERLTPFQKDVLMVTADIPLGQVRPYRWIAYRIGKPGASRAVGNTLNANPYPLRIPCHRVVREGGSIGGFARGRRAKRRLLASEGIDWLRGT